MTVLSTSVASPSVMRRTDLPVMAASFAHQARHALEHGFHRLRADRHDAVLDFARQLLEFVEADDDGRGARKSGLGDALRQHRLVDDEFADEIDQAVDPVEIDADRLRRADLASMLGIRPCRPLARGRPAARATCSAALAAAAGSAELSPAAAAHRREAWTRARSAATSSRQRRRRPPGAGHPTPKRSRGRNPRRRIRTLRGSPPRPARSSSSIVQAR